MKDLKIIYSRHNTDACATRIHTTAIPYYDLTLLLRGNLSYTVNGEKIDMKPGDAIFLPPQTLRHREAGEEKSDFLSFNFTMSDKIKIPIHMERVVGNDITLLIAAYDEFARRPYFDNREKHECLISCILHILDERMVQKKYNPLTLKIMEYIHTNISNKITLEVIGQVTFFSPVYCDMVFKKETGRSIIDFLIEERISESKKLLAEDSIPLATISELVGFDDYNYFSRVFKKRVGCTPSEYRKRTTSEIRN